MLIVRVLVSRDILIARQAERHRIKHAQPILVAGAQLSLKIFRKEVIALTDERLREVPPGRLPPSTHHLFHHAWTISAYQEALLFGKGFHGLNKDMQAGGALGL